MELLSPRPLKVANWSVLAVLVTAGYFWRGGEFALGVLVGGLLVVVNFHLLHRTLKGTLERVGLSPEEYKGQARAFFAGRQLLRFFVMVAVIYFLVRHEMVNIFGLLVGLSTVVLTLMLIALHEVIKLKNKEANPSHGTSHPVS